MGCEKDQQIGRHEEIKKSLGPAILEQINRSGRKW